MRTFEPQQQQQQDAQADVFDEAAFERAFDAAREQMLAESRTGVMADQGRELGSAVNDVEHASNTEVDSKEDLDSLPHTGVDSYPHRKCEHQL